MPELVCTHTSCNYRNLVSAHVWRVTTVATTATSTFGFMLGLSLGYGLEFMFGMLSMESGTLP
jgi:hypothetical protein